MLHSFHDLKKRKKKKRAGLRMNEAIPAERIQGAARQARMARTVAKLRRRKE